MNICLVKLNQSVLHPNPKSANQNKSRLLLSASLTFYLFSPTRLINSIKHEHSYKILYVDVLYLIQSSSNDWYNGSHRCNSPGSGRRKCTTFTTKVSQDSFHSQFYHCFLLPHLSEALVWQWSNILSRLCPSTFSKYYISKVSWPILIKISCKALSGREKLHKVKGLIGVELWLPWQHIAPIDLKWEKH